MASAHGAAPWRPLADQPLSAVAPPPSQEHLFIVTELLRDNLYELYRYIGKSGWPPYFTLPRVRAIGRQARALPSSLPRRPLS